MVVSSSLKPLSQRTLRTTAEVTESRVFSCRFEVGLFQGGHHATGNHIHGSDRRFDLLAGGGAAGGGADLWTGVPPVLRTGKAGQAAGRGGIRAEVLRRYGERPCWR